MRVKSFITNLFITSMAILCMGLSEAQTNQYTIFVPFSAGGSVDIVARIIGQQITAETKIPTVIDNRIGAGGNIAAALTASSKPNGFNLLAHHQGIVYSAALNDNSPFKLEKDLVPVATVGYTPNVLVVNINSPFNNLREFIEYSKKNPGLLNYGSAGVGSNGHLAMELFSSAAGIKLTHIPYKGMPQAIADVVGGQVQAVLTTIPAALPFIQGGRVKALATSGSTRSKVLKDIPTFLELDVKNFTYEPWYGFLAPGQTPVKELDKLSNIIVASTNNPESAKRFTQEGIEIRPLNRLQFEQQFHKDIIKWTEVIQKMHIQN